MKLLAPSLALCLALLATAAPESTPPTTEPRLLGKIPDGTPPPLPKPKDGFEVQADQILQSQTRHDGGRKITVQRIHPVPLAPVPEADTPSLPLDEGTRETLRALHATRPAARDISMRATVYHFPDGAIRSLVQYQIIGQKSDKLPRGEVKLWSNADFSLIPGVQSFIGSDGITYRLMMFWNPIHIDQLTHTYKRFGKTWQPPEIPDLPTGKVTFALTGDSATDSQLIAPVASLHQIYQQEDGALRVARDRRVRADAARKAELAANPPKPKDITLNYWITETPAPAKGGNP